MNIDRKNIFYTSSKDTTTKSSADFRATIKDAILKSSAVIQIITNNYKKSEVCLNEMGAAWVLSENVIPFIVDPVSFDNIGFIHNTTQLLKLNTEEDLFKFQDDHPELYEGRRIVQSNYHKQVKEFIKGFNGFNTYGNPFY